MAVKIYGITKEKEKTTEAGKIKSGEYLVYLEIKKAKQELRLDKH